MTTLTKTKLQNDEKGCLRNTAKRTKNKKERQAATKRCQEIDIKGRENWWLYKVKILKYPLERH